MKKITTILFCSLFFSSFAQLSITSGLDTSQLTNLLQGLGVTISNTTINCDSSAYGMFTGNSEVDINHGLILSTGKVSSIDSAASVFANTSFASNGDADLDTLLNVGGSIQYVTHDGCTLEFDAIPNDDTLYLNFAFGSEEYPEYVGSSFNDIFAIFIKGDGYSQLTNIATLPDQTVVSINTVNVTVNSSEYIDNALGQHIVFDGLTSNILVEKPVTPDSIYHFKIAIADAGDYMFDSGVMLQAFSFRCSKAIDESAGIKNLEMNSMVYPNPVKETMTLNFDGSKANLEILNLMGRKVAEMNDVQSGQKINVSELSDGMYYLKIVTEKGAGLTKFLVRKGF